MSIPTSKKQRSNKNAPAPKAEGVRHDVTAELTINPIDPIPLELENIFSFSAGGDKFIPFFSGTCKYYGANGFLVQMLNWRKESVTQNACIVSKTNYAIGDGIYIDGVDKDKVNDPIWTSFLKRCNNKPKGFNAVLKEVFDNFFTFGNVPIEIVRGTVAGKKFLYVYAKNPLDCRKAWPDDNGDCNAMIVSRWFRKPGVYNLTEKFNIRIPLYKMGDGSKKSMWIEDTTDNQGKPVGKGVFRTALWLKNDFPGYDHYGIPSWLPAMRNAMLEANGAQFNLDNIDNNMVVGGVLVLAGNVTQQEEQRIANQITRKYTGKGKSGRTIVISSEEGISDSKYTPQSTHKEGSYIEMDKLSSSKLIMANEWDEAFLGGHDGASKAKSGAYLNELYQQKIKTVIKPVHRVIKDDFIAPLCEIADEWLGTKWSEYDIDIQISNLFDDTTEASTTVLGGQLFLSVVGLVSSGAWDIEGAVAFAQAKFGMEEEQARKILGGIKVIKPEPTDNNNPPKDNKK